MSYYIKVGKENDTIPECCTECWMRRDTVAACRCCTIPNQTTANPSYGTEYVQVHYCVAHHNRILQNISKKPEWCPIVIIGRN